MDRADALARLHELVQSDSLRRHCLSVEAVMRAAAVRYGTPGDDAPDVWGITGLLHDADYEAYPEQHPNVIVAWLRERGEEAIAYAISAHSTQWNVPYTTTLSRAIVACDELTGFITACARVSPNGIHGLTPPSVLSKIDKRKFAEKVDRHELRAGAELLGVPLEDHIAFVIDALRARAADLGIA
jgi:predicted hydrolase (HD superfamily)